jgi:hypothetical protein
MRRRFKFFVTFGLLAGVPVGALWAQAQPAPATPAPAQAAPPATAQPVPPPAPVLPPPIWDPRDAQQLLVYIRQVGGEGLNPVNYDPAGLEAALRSGSPEIMSQAATERFNLLSSDLALGFVPRKERKDWYVKDPDLDSAAQDALLRSALAQHRVVEALNGLLPTHPQYSAL